MIRFSICISTVLLLLVFLGCGNSNTPTDGTSKDGDDSPPETETTGTANTSAIESSTLKQAMIDVAVDLMKKQQPDIDPVAIRKQVEHAIIQVRKDVPDFLIVSTEDEERIKGGTRRDGVNKRISDAEAFMNEMGIELTGLVTSLLPQHKAGTLSPVRTELLAQLIVADMKKVNAALTN